MLVYILFTGIAYYKSLSIAFYNITVVLKRCTAAWIWLPWKLLLTIGYTNVFIEPTGICTLAYNEDPENLPNNTFTVCYQRLRKILIWKFKPVNATPQCVQKITVKPVLSSHSKIDKTKVLKTNNSLMKVESIAECSLGAFCNTFDLH